MQRLRNPPDLLFQTHILLGKDREVEAKMGRHRQRGRGQDKGAGGV
jgi:hypothetical protein